MPTFHHGLLLLLVAASYHRSLVSTLCFCSLGAMNQTNGGSSAHSQTAAPRRQSQCRMWKVTETVAWRMKKRERFKPSTPPHTWSVTVKSGHYLPLVRLHWDHGDVQKVLSSWRWDAAGGAFSVDIRKTFPCTCGHAPAHSTILCPQHKNKESWVIVF